MIMVNIEGSPYLVMVYLSAARSRIGLENPCPGGMQYDLLIPIARALEYTHEHNIINRDVKPSNILMTEKGQPMLTDFGLVKIFEDKGSTNLTASGCGAWHTRLHGSRTMDRRIYSAI